MGLPSFETMITRYVACDRVSAKLAEDLQTINLWQPHVEKDDVGLDATGQLVADLAVPSDGNGASVVVKPGAVQLRNIRIILDHQDVHTSVPVHSSLLYT